ncbi:hypothetical protein [Dyadobacter sp. CY261]|uniref:hypothetical protein n=1 Tax=Dyadobacter sp. CY261 TaxID=2907203 RepID=UPI001F346A91|nr:hypothetical protein [Dyadobacter sp. CY261]
MKEDYGPGLYEGAAARQITISQIIEDHLKTIAATEGRKHNIPRSNRSNGPASGHQGGPF